MQAVTAIYQELKDFYAEIAPKLGEHAHGARILYTPPLKNARLMFVGIQPGGSETTVDTTWPANNEYAYNGARYLGQCLRQIVDPELLKHTVGSNANFFRSKGMNEYQKVPLDLRKRIAAFCTPRICRLISVLNPEVVFCIGMTAFKTLRPDRERIENTRPRSEGILIRSGELDGKPVLAVPHLTGARSKPTPDELKIIAAKLKSLLD